MKISVGGECGDMTGREAYEQISQLQRDLRCRRELSSWRRIQAISRFPHKRLRGCLALQRRNAWRKRKGACENRETR